MGDVEEEDEDDEDVRMRERVLAGEGGRQVGEWLRGVVLWGLCALWGFGFWGWVLTGRASR